MFDHVSIQVTNLARALAFYDAALAPLGITRLYAEGGSAHGYGIAAKAFFWIGERDTVQTGTHIAFVAKDRATVDRFHAAALAAGGTENGPPGLRPRYHADYYAAFILDPDGHNIEAVCRAPLISPPPSQP